MPAAPEFVVVNRKNAPPLSRQTWHKKRCVKCDSADIEKIDADDELPDWHTWICNDCYHQWYYDEKTVNFRQLKPRGKKSRSSCYT